MTFQLLWPDGPEALDPAALARCYRFPSGRVWVRGSMVSTVDGAATGTDGLSGSISSAPDRVILRLMRGLADVVLVGSGTVRAEGYRRVRPHPEHAEARRRAGQPPAAPLAVVTGSARLPDKVLDEPDGHGGLLVITVATAPGLPELTDRLGSQAVIVAGDREVDLAEAVAALAGRGLNRIVCEGGPGLLAQVAAADLLDELCLTTTPVLAGADAGRVLSGAEVAAGHLHLGHLLLAEHTVFSRWLVRR